MPQNTNILQEAQAMLLRIVSNRAGLAEEEFFKEIEGELCDLCKAIAEEVDSSSCAVFFVTEDNPPGSQPFMVMRGASGRLWKTFDGLSDKWRQWRKEGIIFITDAERGKDSKASPRLEYLKPKFESENIKLSDDAFVESGEMDSIYMITDGDKTYTIKKEEDKLKVYGQLNLDGFAYSSELTNVSQSIGQKEWQQIIEEWSVTNQIWHRARGRIANSNLAMDKLQGSTDRIGLGDNLAYPGKCIDETFRTMIGVPIFAHGGSIDIIQSGNGEKTRTEYPASASSRAEFLSKYRVIGILKVEGKNPPHCRMSALKSQTDKDKALEDLGKMLKDHLKDHLEDLELIDEEMDKIENWCIEMCGKHNESSCGQEKFCEILIDTRLLFVSKLEYQTGLNDRDIPDGLRQEFENNGSSLSRNATISTQKTDGEWRIVDNVSKRMYIVRKEEGKINIYHEDLKRAFRIRKEIADFFARYCHAEFIRQDMELLVLLAMQVGRLMIRRIIKYAAEKRIIITENEVGMLNVRWSDIDDLVSLREAAEAARQEIEYHLEAAKAKLDFDKCQAVYRARVSDLSPRGPISSVQTRCKEYISLIRKLVTKQLQLEDVQYTHQLSVPDFKCQLTNYDFRSGERCITRGNARIFLHRPDIGKEDVDILAKLGVEGAPKISVESRGMPAALDKHENFYDINLPLVQRILSPEIYRVDDLAGARIITDYESDIDEILDELRAGVAEWGMELGKIDDMREGKMGGYRAVHVTLYITVDSLLALKDVNILRRALQLTDSEALKIPVEVQLRTAYQHSWALKTHNISYKREKKIPQELRDEHEILSNVLGQADWLSDIVRDGIENKLMPTDYGERGLLNFLQRRISRDDMTIVKFGIDCAKEILKDQLRYSGEPEYSFAMQMCESLVYSFGIIDSQMLLLVLLRNIWRTQRDESGQSISQDEKHDDIVYLLCRRLGDICPAILSRYRRRLPLSPEQQKQPNWFEAWMDQFPTWFWAMQHSFLSYFRQTPESRTKQWKERLKEIYDELTKRHKEGQWRQNLDEWFKRAYLVEIATLLACLAELPFEPGRTRRKTLHDDYLSLFREIYKYLPNGSIKTQVNEEVDRVFRKLETELDLPRKPQWWEE